VKIIYAGRRACKTVQEAAQEVARQSGDDCGVWQISRALLWNKGFVNGVPVFAKEIGEAGAGAGNSGEEPRSRAAATREPLLRIEDAYTGGIPPRWR
jgi:hypothetical protein